MFDGLDGIDWSALEHAHGPATDVPAMLRDLVSDDEETRSDAQHAARGNIYHQGTVFSATAHVVPFLFEIAATPSAPDRTFVFPLLDAIAHGASYLDVHLDESTLAGDPERAQQRDVELGWVRDCRTAVTAGAPICLRLLADDESPRVRANAAWLLGLCTDSADAVIRQVRESAASDADAATRASALFSLGVLAGTAHRETLETVMRQADDARIRVTAAIALGRFVETDELSIDVLDALLAGVTHQLEGTDELPFARGDFMARIAATCMRASLDDRPLVARLLLDAAEDDRGAALSLAFPLLYLTFGEPAPRATWKSLTELQRRALVYVAERAMGRGYRFGNLVDELRGFGLEELAERVVRDGLKA